MIEAEQVKSILSSYGIKCLIEDMSIGKVVNCRMCSDDLKLDDGQEFYLDVNITPRQDGLVYTLMLAKDGTSRPWSVPKDKVTEVLKLMGYANLSNRLGTIALDPDIRIVTASAWLDGDYDPDLRVIGAFKALTKNAWEFARSTLKIVFQDASWSVGLSEKDRKAREVVLAGMALADKLEERRKQSDVDMEEFDKLISGLKDSVRDDLDEIFKPSQDE